MKKPKTTKTAKAKHPFPKAVYANGRAGDETYTKTKQSWKPALSPEEVLQRIEHLNNGSDLIAEYTLTRVLKVNRTTTFEKID